MYANHPTRKPQTESNLFCWTTRSSPNRAMDDYYYASDPWSAFYHPAYSQPLSYSRRRPFMPTPATTPGRPVPSRALAPSLSPVLAQKPRVVSVPVRYVDVEGQDNRRTAAMGLSPSEAATSIQSVFRGFFVRRMMERVSQIAAQVDKIEDIIASDAERDKFRSEPLERLLVGETLMALLLCLDSVVGFREYRRKVIRRVIRLQEILDSILAAEQMPDAPTQTADEVVEKKDSEETASDKALEEQQSLGKAAVAESADALIPHAEETTGEVIVKMVDMPQEYKAEEMTQQEDDSDAIAGEEDVRDNRSEVLAYEEIHASDDEFDDFVVVPMDEDFSSLPAAAEPESCKENYFGCNDDAAERDTAPPEPTEAAIEPPATVEKNSRSGREIEDVVEKVMTESKKLQRLVAALCERNTQQCLLIAGLVTRVDRLEQIVQKM